MIKLFLSSIIFFLPLAAMETPRFVLSKEHCQAVVTLLEEKAEHYPHTGCASTCIIPSIRELSWYYKYGKNCGELHQIIDAAVKKMVKQNSNKLLTQAEFEAGLHKLILEGIRCKEIEHRLKEELKLQ